MRQVVKSIINVVATLALTVAFVKVADASRKPNLTAHQQREALQRRDAGEPTREIARTYNVSHSTISRLSDVT